MQENVLPYLKSGLHIKTASSFIVDIDVQSYWDWSIHKGNHEAPEVLSILHHHFAQHPSMHLYFALGYYDLDIPYFGSQRNIHQLLLSDKQQQRIRQKNYPAGHVVYWDQASRLALYQDTKQFYQTSK